MSKRSRSPAGREDYTVGYGKPPMHSRFRPGQSGNPSGRRKGVPNLATDVKRTLMTPVKVKEAGRTRKKSTQEGALMVLREKALQGDLRAIARVLELAQRFNNDANETGPTQALSANDQAVLDAYIAERNSAKTITPSVDPADRVIRVRRRRPRKKGAK
jgi:Family of unknown function (DUF5681)